MKNKFIFLSFALALCLLIISGCDSKEETEPTENNNPSENIESEPLEKTYTVEIDGVVTELASNDSASLENYLAEYIAFEVSVSAESTVVVKLNGEVITNLKAEDGKNNVAGSNNDLVIQSDAVSDIYLKLWADGSYTLFVSFGPVNGEYYENYQLDEERLYTGYMIDGVPNGEGTLTWVNTNCVYEGEFVDGKYEGKGTFYWKNLGDSLTGTFKNNCPLSGKYVYSNTMSYTGEFNSAWQFHGQGSFDWNTYNEDGSIKEYGWLYEGEFINGSPSGCVGKITFSEARKNPNSEGIHWFEGVLDGFPSIKKNQNCKGKIVFSDKSIYEGDLLYDENGAWLRYGEGIQYFYTSSNYTGASVGGDINDLLYCYKGQFDSINHSYIYGNGVMYICDSNLNPVAYIKGCWDGTTRTADWLPQLGEWSDDLLLEEYKNVQEIPFVHGYYATLKGLVDRYKNIDLSEKTLLIGASHFTMWYDQAMIDLAPEFDVLNFGIGGSNAYFWDTNLDLLEGFKNDPKCILLQISGNISSGDTEENIAIMQSVITKLHNMFPTTQIVYVSRFNTISTYYTDWAKEYTISSNRIMKEWIETNTIQNDKFIDVTHFVFDENATSGEYYIEGYGYMYTNIWLSDNLHLNAEGHKKFAAAIKEAMK